MQPIAADQQPSAQVLRCGAAELQPLRLALRAGPFSCVYENGDLRDLRLGTTILVQRLYAAVRDRHWNTIPFVISDQCIEVHADRFTISYQARHRQGGIDFVRRMTIAGDADGAIRLAMDGEVLSAFARNRLGFCVLHPTPDCAGTPFTVVHGDGHSEACRFPVRIQPDQPCFDIAALIQEPLPGVRTTIAFSGEVFEMEDQRNYGDSSFKTYSTPQARPKPVELPVGATIAQTVAIRVDGMIPDLEPAASAATGGAVLAIDTRARPLPRLGLGAASHDRRLDAVALRRLAALRLAHLRVELRLDRPDWAARLLQAGREAAALGAQLEITALVGDDAEAQLTALATSARQLSVAVHAWLVMPGDGGATGAALLASAHRRLAEVAAGALIGGGTSGYFMNLNARRPPASGFDAVAYAVYPQVHADDTTSLFDNLDAHAEAVASAQALCGGAKVLCGPITLKGRDRETVDDDGLPASVDMRQPSLAAAVWTLGSIARLAAAGAHSATYFETSGWLGVLEDDQASPRPPRFPSRPGTVFPLYHVLADLAEFASGSSHACAGAPGGLAALVVRKDGRERILLGNGTPAPLSLALRGQAAQVRVKRLDETTAWRAMTDPEAWRGEAGGMTASHDGVLALTLPPYGLVRIDRE